MRSIRRPPLLAVLAALVPVVVAVGLAYLLGFHDQRNRVSFLAAEGLHRAGATSDQLFEAFTALADVKPSDVCSPDNIVRMRQLALKSPYLAGLGYISEDALRCSSFGSESSPVAVGPPTYISATGFAIRAHHVLQIAPGTELVLASAPSGLTGFFHPALVLTMPGADDHTSVGVVAASTKILLMSTGSSDINWNGYSLPEKGQSVTSVVDGRILAVSRSPKWDTFSYAAVPLSAAFAESRELLVFFVPAGVLAALATFWCVQRLAVRQRSVLMLLKRALRRKEISVEFQPIVDLASGRWIGAEALARWRQPSGEEVPADVFIRLAEERGLIVELTRQVLAQGTKAMAPLVHNAPSFFVGFNLSASDLETGTLLGLLNALVQVHSLEPRNIHLEITERQSVEKESQLTAVECLRAAGFAVGTDDFGIGSSNLSYLSRIPLDYIKIDRSLIQISLSENTPYDIVDTIVGLAGARGLQVIAEGIETEAQRSQLLRHGVAIGQGWMFGRSMPPERFYERFAEIERAFLLKAVAAGRSPASPALSEVA